MLEQYRTIYEGGQGEIVEKKSRFIATVRLVKTEEEAVKFIEEMKKKYWDQLIIALLMLLEKEKKLCVAVMMENLKEQQESLCWMCF